MRWLTPCSQFLPPFLFLCCLLLVRFSSVFAQGNSIRNFRVVEMSPAELVFTVNYSYGTARDISQMNINTSAHIMLWDSDGNEFSRGYEWDIITSDNHSITFRIKKTTAVDNFTSAGVRVCLSK